MLNTWKQPAPGSLDTRPVFPPEITRNIESALIKARTAALQHQQTRAQPDLTSRGRANGTPPGWTNSPAPQNMSRNQLNQYQGHSTLVRLLSFCVLQRRLIWIQTPPPNQRQHIDLNYLNRDVDTLIAAAKVDFANSPFNPTSQQRLKALVDLQAILQKQQLTQEQLKIVRDQVSTLAATRPPSAAPNPSANGPTVPPPQLSTPPVQPVSQPLQQLLNPGTLAELIKATASRQQPTPPPAMSAALPQMPQMPQIPQQNGTPQPVAENPLIAALRARGLLPSGPTPPSLTSSASSTPVPGRSTLPFIMANGAPPTPQISTQVPATNSTSGVPMSTASMKIPRFGLIVSLYDSRPNKCGTCGRRFFATEEGKEMKARHLDWHFKTNQRMTESSRRAQNRSWYVDERVCFSLFLITCSVLTNNRIGSNLAKLVTKTALQTPKPRPKELRARMETPSKSLQSHGFEPRTMPPSVTPHAPSARRSSNQHGPRMSRIGSGKTQPKSDLVCTTLAAIPKSPRALLRRAKRGLVRLTRCWASAKLR
jgi:pre-mRNA cleavage complex 2 protein Pcf11